MDKSLRLARGTSAGGFVFEAKLRGPRPSRELVSRPRLTGVLESARPALALVSAPPGFGKTTLLGQWREVDPRPFAWLTLDSGDNDPVAFWSGVVEAIRQVEPGFGRGAALALASSPNDVLDAVVPLVLHELSEIRGEIVLVLDDYHTIDSPACHAAVAFFCERNTCDVQLVVSSRRDPPIPIAKLRAVGDLLEIRAVDLCFTEEEEAAFLNEGLSLGLDDEAIALLRERTEGWPAGVYLASISIRNADDPGEFVAGFNGANRHVVDYLTEVALSTLEEKHQRFLLRTSVLDRFCSGLCDTVNDATGSVLVLAELEQANVFLIPLDDHREWYRYHPLFAGALQSQLAMREPELVRVLNARASMWFAEAGELGAAVHHALAADDFETASDLTVSRLLDDPDGHLARSSAVLHWLDEFPREALNEDAQLALVEAFGLGMANDHAGAEAALQVVESAADRTLPDGSSLDAASTLVRACFTAGDVGKTLTAAERAVGAGDELTPLWRPVARLVAGRAAHDAGDSARARPFLEDSAMLAARSRQPLVLSAAQALLGRIALEAGEVSEAEIWAREAVKNVESHGASDKPGAGFAYVALGSVLARKGQTDAGGRLLVRGLARLRAGSEPLDVADALLALAPVRRSLGTLAKARSLVDEARAIIEACDDPGVFADRLEEVARTLTPAHRRVDGQSDLTERELEVLRYLAQGLPKRDIGKALFLSYNTIHSHTKSIYQKLRVSSRQAAIERARELGAL
jgi:LuxR family transcriptional regulator, maltose regulon positive regulatory protein